MTKYVTGDITKKDNWYCKINIRRKEPVDITLDDISEFFPSELLDMMEDYIAAFDDDTYDVSNGENRVETSLSDKVINFLLEHQELSQELYTAPKRTDYSPRTLPRGIYEGFGEIITWLNSTHLLSYMTNENCVYALTCFNPDKPTLYSVLDAYTFWQATDVDKLIVENNLPNDAKIHKALLIDAYQRFLGIWEPIGAVFGYNEGSLAIMKMLDIDMFELDKEQRVTHAYYMNPVTSEYMNSFLTGGFDNCGERYICSTGSVIVQERMISDFDGNAVIQERIYKYPEFKRSGRPFGEYYYKPCAPVCPLAAMHVVADCICGDNCVHDEYASQEQQIEICERPGDFLANGCLTDNGMVIYRCSKSNAKNRYGGKNNAG